MQVFHSNFHPFVFDRAANSFQLVDQTENGRKCYYQIKNSHLCLVDRIGQIALVVYKIISNLFTGSFSLSSDTKAYWREGIYGKKEIIVVVANPTGLTFPIQCSQYDLSHFIYYASRLTRNNTNLHLGRVHLAALSNSIEHLTALESLSMSNELRGLPDSIGHLGNLRELWLNGNQLQKLPDSIGDLAALQYLYVSNNRLEELPDTVGHLGNLQNLFLSDNSLQSIPETIGQLESLQELRINGNQLRELPDSIGHLGNLHYLFSRNNRLRQIPDSIGQLTNLQQVDFQNNQLQEIPDSLGHLTRLSYLDLSHNRLQTVPETLYRLPASCRVILQGNPFSEQVIEQALIRMQNENYQGPQIIFSWQDRRRIISREQEGDLKAVLVNWCDEQCKQKLLERLSSMQKPVLFDWLKRLIEIASYRTQMQTVKDNVQELLSWMVEEADEGKLQIAYQIMADATGTCGDRVELSYNLLCLHVKMCQSGNLSLQELKALLIGAERYDRLNRIAEQKCRQMHIVDQIEVHLFYEIKLKDELKLPLEAKEMLYERLADVTAEDIEAAKAQILAETGPDKQGELLLKHPVWKAALQKCAGFAEIDQACQERKAEALSQLEDSDSAAEQFYQTFQEKEKTVWNPYYILTQQILREEEAA
ncbi:leucine-rich repeat domain-containing protein [Candidatus Protochlamydia phocaeensis]|uniref:leucine-rich repeat domain-containing protein n=1 Tax=Candidatus Protochlamydia phocaeensis TaxID=1414722 RepID=UPI000838DF6A|nr:NEL-type E3 ubiquitin ligase domain-containing protein [Candidatus Protochlamydia phocaeensis]